MAILDCFILLVLYLLCILPFVFARPRRRKVKLETKDAIKALQTAFSK